MRGLIPVCMIRWERGIRKKYGRSFTIRKLDELFVIVSDGAGSPVPG